MAPTQKSFAGAHTIFSKVNKRLEDKKELVANKGVTKARLYTATLLQSGVEPLLIKMICTAPILLGTIEGEVRMFHQSDAVGRVMRRDGDAGFVEARRAEHEIEGIRAASAPSPNGHPARIDEAMLLGE